MNNKILIVDDDLLSLKVTGVLLRAKGYEIETLDNASGVFDAIANFQPGLIILDAQLPDGDGRLICDQLKTSDLTKHIGIIICSGLSDLETCYEQQGPPDLVLQKPFDINLFLQKINEMLTVAA